MLPATSGALRGTADKAGDRKNHYGKLQMHVTYPQRLAMHLLAQWTRCHQFFAARDQVRGDARLHRRKRRGGRRARAPSLRDLARRIETRAPRGRTNVIARYGITQRAMPARTRSASGAST